MLRIAILLFVLFGGAAWAGPGHDHGAGHGHGHDGPARDATAPLPRLKSVSFDIELVAIADGHKLTIYLDDSTTNAPIVDATVVVSGAGIEPLKATRLSDGTFQLDADWLDEPGTKPLAFSITYGDKAGLVDGVLRIPPPTKVTDDVHASDHEMFSDPVFWALVGGAAVFGFVLAFAFRPGVGSRGAALALAAVLAAAVDVSPADAHEDHNHAGPEVSGSGEAPRKLASGDVFLPKPTQRLLEIRTAPVSLQQAAKTRELIGTVVPDPSAFGQVQAPMDGQIEISGRGISFVGQQVKAGEVLALLAPAIPIADLGTMQQLRAEVEGKLKIAELRLQRLTRISNVVAQRDIEDTRAELAALKEQKRVLAQKGIEKFELVAPVGGVIAVANVRAGQVVNARDTLFEIVDPERLWVEAIGTDQHADDNLEKATAIDDEGHTLPLSYVGRSPTLRQQSRPVLFRVDGPHPGLAVGAQVKVLAKAKAHVEGFIIPDTAIVRGANGLPQVWVKEGPERFRAVPVRVQPLDGVRSVALAGVEAEMLVVVSGGEFINQVR